MLRLIEPGFPSPDPMTNSIRNRVSIAGMLALLFVLAAPMPLHAALYDRGAEVGQARTGFQNHIETLSPAPRRMAQNDEPAPSDSQTPPSEKEAAPSAEEQLDPRLLDDRVSDDPFADPAGGGDEDPFADPLDGVYEEDPFETGQPDIPPLGDPFEGFNRSIYTFNDHVFEYVLRPVGEVYRDYVGEEFRIALRNLYNVFSAPATLVSCVVQGKFKKAGTVLLRTTLNLVAGWGGMLDVAGQEYGFEAVDEDFGQALGFYWIPPGPYLMLPFLGPSTVRDTVGLAVDSVLNPLFWLVPDALSGFGVTSGRVVNETTFIIDDKKALDESAIDPYESIRDFYHQSREKKIRE